MLSLKRLIPNAHGTVMNFWKIFAVNMFGKKLKISLQKKDFPLQVGL